MISVVSLYSIMVLSRFVPPILTLSEFLYQYNDFVLLLSRRICYLVTLAISSLLLFYRDCYQIVFVVFNIATESIESDENGNINMATWRMPVMLFKFPES